VRSRIAFATVCIAALIACHAERVTLSRAQLGTPAARQIGSFGTPGGHRELTPSNVPEAALDDEAVLVRASGAETCIDVTLRSEQDSEVSAFAPVFVLDGARITPAIADERASTIAVPEGSKPEACAQDTLGPVAAFCVAVRTARLCAPRGARAVELRLVHPSLVYRSDVTTTHRRYELAFAWTVRP
jgi:hypothetical protein